ncbi:MAG: type VI secretion system contractile sheath large subunit [Rhodospirillales bacterium]
MNGIGLDVLTSVASAADVVTSDAPDNDLPGLRADMLAGRFVGRNDIVLADSFADFLSGDASDAVLLWFGPDLGRRLMLDPNDLRGALDRDVAALDTMLSEQLDAILHDGRFRKLEGGWRGLAWLVDGVEQGTKLKIKALNASWAEICRDLERAVEFDQSQLFKKIYEDEFGTPGGEPYGLMVVDHEVRHRPTATARTDDVNALTLLSGVAAASFCPTILAAAPVLLDAETFADLNNVSDISRPLRDTDHARWRTLGSRSDMRFVGIALPRLLARQPWEADGTRADNFSYTEYAPTTEERVWMNPAFAFAVVVARAFAQYAWPADVRGAETDRVGGGLVDGAPIEPFRTDAGHTWTRMPVEIVWNDRQERELLDAGLMPLSAIPYSEELVFGAVRSVLTPQRSAGPTVTIADANARLSSQINSILCASRFAHHLKMKGRQMVGSFKTADEIQRSLQQWLTTFINGNLNANGETRARFPLVNGKVSVTELAAKPGVFGCVLHLQPHYQLDDVSATFQLVTDLGGR